MTDLAAYRAAIGLFISRGPRTDSQRSQLRFIQLGFSQFYGAVAILFLAELFVLAIHLSACTTSTEQSEALSISNTLTFPDASSLNFVSRCQHFLVTNKGAHAYNGNGPTTTTSSSTPSSKRHKRPRSPSQPSLMSMFLNKRPKTSDPDTPEYPEEVLVTPTKVTANQKSTLVMPGGSTNCISDSDDDDLIFSPPRTDRDVPESSQKRSCPTPETTGSASSSKKSYDVKFSSLASHFSERPELKSWCLRSTKGQEYIFCSFCSRDVKIASRGIMDVNRHEQTDIHKDNVKLRSTTKSINAHFSVPSSDSISTQVTKAEVLWANFLAEHQLSFKISDHASKLFKVMFPDSQIAKQFKCGRTKAKSILCESVAPNLQEQIVSKMKSQKFTLLTDDTTDVSTKQQCCILVRLFDEALGTVRGYVYKVLNLTSATGSSIYEGIVNVFKEDGIPLSNLFAMGTDGANTMIGTEKGLYGRLKKVQSKIVSVWCICHRIHLVAKKCVSEMPQDINELPVLLFYYFKKSSKRNVELKKMQDFCGVVNHKLLKPSDTRWLAMQEISERLTEQWEPLKSYFNSLPLDYEFDSEGKQLRKLDKFTKDKIVKIKGMLNSDLNRMCFIFLKDFLKKFTTFNKFFQTTEPVAYKIHEKMSSLYKDILNCFVKPQIVRENRNNLLDIDIENTQLFLNDEDMWMGDAMIFDILGSLEDNGKEEDAKQFRSTIKSVFQKALKEMKQLPFKDSVLTNLKCLDPALQGVECVRSNFMCLAPQFPDLVNKSQLGELDSELRNYDTYDMPSEYKTTKSVTDYWIKVGKININNIPTFPLVFEFVKTLLIIPHGNAESEQLFSRLKLVKSKFRTRLHGTTLNAILAVNFNSECDCYDFKPSGKMIGMAKNAASKNNEKTSSAEEIESDFEDEVEELPKRLRKPRLYENFVM